MYSTRLQTTDQRISARYYPENALTVKNKDLDCELVFIDEADKFKLMIYTGTKSKYDEYYRYSSREKRQQHLTEWATRRKMSIDSKQQYKDKKKAPVLAVLPFNVGEILYNSWGYDQTNIDWYQVIEVKSASTIIIQEIDGQLTSSKSGFMSGYSMPVPDSFRGDLLTKRVTWYEGKPRVKDAYKWDGNEQYVSWYA